MLLVNGFWSGGVWVGVAAFREGTGVAPRGEGTGLPYLCVRGDAGLRRSKKGRLFCSDLYGSISVACSSRFELGVRF